MPAPAKISVVLTGREGPLTEHALNALERSGRCVYAPDSLKAHPRPATGWSSTELRPLTSASSGSAPDCVAELWHVVDREAREDAAVIEYLGDQIFTDAQALGAGRIVIVVCAVTLALLGHATLDELSARLAADCAGKDIACTLISVGPFLQRAGPRTGQPQSSASVLIRILLAEAGGFPDQSPAGRFSGHHLRLLSWEQVETGIAQAASDTSVSKVTLRGDEVIMLDDLVAIVRNLVEHTKSPVHLPEPAEPSSVEAVLAVTTGPSAGIEGATTSAGGVQVDDVANEAAHVVRAAGGDSALASFATEVVNTSDGVPVRVYSRRAGKPALVFVNAYGMPADLLVPLSRTLPDMDFYTWESRYVPVLDEQFDPERTSIASHCADLFDMLDHFGLDQVHLAGWCTGAQVCLRFAHDHPDRVRSLSLINGAFALESLKAVDFHQSILSLLERAASGLQAAAMTQKLAYGDKALQALAERGEYSGGGVPQQNDPHLAQMLSQLFCTPETLHRYATMAVGLWDEPGHAWTVDISAPTLILTSPRDIMSPPHTSLEIATMLGDCARVVELEGGDHYALYNRYRDVGGTLRGFIQSVQDWNGNNEQPTRSYH